MFLPVTCINKQAPFEIRAHTTPFPILHRSALKDFIYSILNQISCSSERTRDMVFHIMTPYNGEKAKYLWLRLCLGFAGGSYPSSANQSSILACFYNIFFFMYSIENYILKCSFKSHVKHCTIATIIPHTACSWWHWGQVLMALPVPRVHKVDLISHQLTSPPYLNLHHVWHNSFWFSVISGRYQQWDCEAHANETIKRDNDHCALVVIYRADTNRWAYVYTLISTMVKSRAPQYIA